MSIIKIENLYFCRKARVIFKNLYLQIRAQKITAIMGPSGCGKTTLLKLMTGELTEYSGKIFIEDQDLSKIKPVRLNDLRKKMGILFQTGALFSDLDVFDNIALPIREHTNLPESFIEELVNMKLKSVSLKGTERLMPSELSVGMLKRIALARTIALDPSIILYDEPFSGQDPISISILLNLIRLLNKSLKITTILVSHDVHETLSIADYVYIINDKKIVLEGTPNKIENTSDNFVKKFLKKGIKYDRDIDKKVIT